MTLSLRQIAIVVAAGALLWFAAVMGVRFLGPWVFDFGLKHVLVYVLLFPISWPLILIIQRLADLSNETLFLGIGVTTMTTILLDGLVFGWNPGFYSWSSEIRVAGAASILWGAGVFLAVAWWLSRR